MEKIAGVWQTADPISNADCQDMHRYNPYAREKRLAFMNVMKEINAKLE